MTQTDVAFALRVLAVIARADLHDDLWWRTDTIYAPVTFWIKCSDVFSWGTADAEALTERDLPELEQALSDVAAITGNHDYGTELYCARRRRCRPQGAAYPSDERLWPLFDECGPEREAGLDNPYRPGERIKRHAQRVVDERARLAEEIAQAIEVGRGDRCPECLGKPASTQWERKNITKTGRCGAGHRWAMPMRDWPDPARIARGYARKDGQDG